MGTWGNLGELGEHGELGAVFNRFHPFSTVFNNFSTVFNNFSMFSTVLHWFYYVHWSRDSVSPVCCIFVVHINMILVNVHKEFYNFILQTLSVAEFLIHLVQNVGTDTSFHTVQW